MELKKEDQEKIVMAIQAAIGIAAAFFAVRSSTRTKSKHMKKVLDQDAKRLKRLHSLKYRMEKRAIKQKYRQKYKRNNLLHDFVYDKIK